MVDHRRNRLRRHASRTITVLAAGIAGVGLTLACTASTITLAGPTADARRQSLVTDNGADDISWPDVIEKLRADCAAEQAAATIY
ncbi:hypothetical protein [Nocardia sp. NPDC052566]|uniref:hypothetical protein n=1 Tax=Nocardia sp. NPDC052566 TaxID=3364330 RepID=UPI0037C855B0